MKCGWPCRGRLWQGERKFPGSGQDIARHASLKVVPSDLGELRGCPKVVPWMSKGFAKVAPGGGIRPNSANSLLDLGRSWPKLAQTSVKVGPCLLEIGQLLSGLVGHTAARLRRLPRESLANSQHCGVRLGHSSLCRHRCEGRRLSLKTSPGSTCRGHGARSRRFRKIQARRTGFFCCWQAFFVRRTCPRLRNVAQKTTRSRRKSI